MPAPTITEMKVDFIPVFAYGTLRPGFALHTMISPAMELAEEASLPGYALFHVIHHGRTAFPVLKEHPDAVAIGDLLYVRPGAHLDEVIRMETRAGYVCEALTVHVAGGTRPALAFVWPFDECGPRITGDDWANVAWRRS